MRDKLLHSRMKIAEFARSEYVAYAEAGCSIETVLKPEYWAHVASTLRIGDKVEIECEDGSWEMELKVADVGVQSVKMRVKQRWEWTDEESSLANDDDPQYIYEFVPAHKWRVKRVSDGAIVQKHIQDKGDALRIAAEYNAEKAA